MERGTQMANDFLSLILGALGGVAGSFIAPGAGTAAGFSLGAGLGGLLGGADNSSDPGKSSDQEMIRKLAMQLGQSPIAGASGAYENMAGQLASRGLSNSGVAGSAFGGLTGQLLGQRTQNQISGANLLGGIGQTPLSQGAQAGQIIGNTLPLLQEIFDQNKKDTSTSKNQTATTQNMGYNPYSNQEHSLMLSLLGYGNYGKRN
jgi:hypothetical protein